MVGFAAVVSSMLLKSVWSPTVLGRSICIPELHWNRKNQRLWKHDIPWNHYKVFSKQKARISYSNNCSCRIYLSLLYFTVHFAILGPWEHLQSLGRGLLFPVVTQSWHFTLICGFMFIFTSQSIPIFKSLTNINQGKTRAYIYIYKQLNKLIGYPFIWVTWCMSEFWFNRCWFNVCLNVAARIDEATLRLKNYTCQIIHTKGKHF